MFNGCVLSLRRPLHYNPRQLVRLRQSPWERQRWPIQAHLHLSNPFRWWWMSLPNLDDRRLYSADCHSHRSALPTSGPALAHAGRRRSSFLRRRQHRKCRRLVGRWCLWNALSRRPPKHVMLALHSVKSREEFFTVQYNICENVKNPPHPATTITQCICPHSHVSFFPALVC